MTSPTIIQAAGLTVAVAQSGSIWMAYPLTPCCQASGKGSERGVVCRSCYNEVSAMYGDCAIVNPEPGDWPAERIIASWAILDDDALDALMAQIKAVAL